MSEREQVIGGMLSLVLLASVQPCWPGSDKWARAIGGQSSDELTGVATTREGGMILVGYTSSFGAGQSDLWSVKLDAEGQILWQRTHGGAQWDSASVVRATDDGGFIVAGQTDSFGRGESDAWVLRFDASGNVLWQRTFGTKNNEMIRDAQVTQDRGLVLCGTTGEDYPNAWLLRLDSGGRVIWSKVYSTQWDTVATSVSAGLDGGFVIAGWATIPNQEGAWVFKVDRSGRLVWSETLAGERPSNEARVLTTTRDGGCIFAGNTGSFGAGEGRDDAWIVKLNSSGSVDWAKRYGGNGRDEARAIVEKSEGGYIVVGTTGSFEYGCENTRDIWCVDLDSIGEVVWKKAYGGWGDDTAWAIAEAEGNGVIFAGSTSSYGAGEEDAFIVRITSERSSCSGIRVATGSWPSVVSTPVVPAKLDITIRNMTLAQKQTAGKSATSTAVVADLCESAVDSKDGAAAARAATPAPLAKTWARAVGGPFYDELSVLRATPDGGFVMAGDSASFGGQDPSPWVTMVNAKGELIWSNTYPGAGDWGFIRALEVTSDGRLVLAGEWRWGYPIMSQIWIMVLDGSGNLQWQKTYEPARDVTLWAMRPTSDGGYVLAGYLDVYRDSGILDGWVMKIDSAGRQSWLKTYDLSSGDSLFYILQASDGGFIFAGSTVPEVSAYWDVWIVKLNQSGDIVWQKTYGTGSGIDWCTGIEPAVDGGFVVSGLGPSQHPWLMKIDDQGGVVWQKEYRDRKTGDVGAGFGTTGRLPTRDSASSGLPSLRRADDGGYYLLGRSTSFPGGCASDSDGWSMKLDSSGTPLWRRTYGGIRDDSLVGVEPTDGGDLIIAGNTDSFGAGMSDAFILRASSNGNTCSGVMIASGPSPSVSTGSLAAAVAYGTSTSKIANEPAVAAVARAVHPKHSDSCAGAGTSEGFEVRPGAARRAVRRAARE